MATPALETVLDQIAWSYANLARAHAALEAGRTCYVQMDHIIRSRLFGGLKSGRMSMRSIYDDERLKMLGDRKCAYCEASDHLTLDHLMPRIKGGCDDGANLVRACRRCNSSKSGQDMLVWYASRREFPPLLILRRYLKLVASHCETNDLLGCSLGDPRVHALPFPLMLLPTRFPPLSGLRL